MISVKIGVHCAEPGTRNDAASLAATDVAEFACPGQIQKPAHPTSMLWHCHQHGHVVHVGSLEVHQLALCLCVHLSLLRHHSSPHAFHPAGLSFRYEH